MDKESRKKGLELNGKKSEITVVSQEQESPKCNIFIGGVKLKQRNQFNYLGTLIWGQATTCVPDIIKMGYLSVYSYFVFQ